MDSRVRIRTTRTQTSYRSSSLPRTFQREALLRHPELSMELDRLTADPAAAVALVAASGGGGLSTDDQMSDSGAISAPESVINMVARKRGTIDLLRHKF